MTEPLVTLTDHARERAAEMGVGTKLVKRVVRDPETDYVSLNYVDARVATRDDLAVVYNPKSLRVVTVLWNRAEGRVA